MGLSRRELLTALSAGVASLGIEAFGDRIFKHSSNSKVIKCKPTVFGGPFRTINEVRGQSVSSEMAESTGFGTKWIDECLLSISPNECDTICISPFIHGKPAALATDNARRCYENDGASRIDLGISCGDNPKITGYLHPVSGALIFVKVGEQWPNDSIYVLLKSSVDAGYPIYRRFRIPS